MRKINLHKLALQTPTVENTAIYKSYRNVYNKLIRASKRLFYCESLHKAKKNPKKTWEILNDALGRSSMPPKIDKLSKNGNAITEPTEIANAFNEFFSTAGSNIAESVNPTGTEP
jgi:hypothetical protein